MSRPIKIRRPPGKAMLPIVILVGVVIGLIADISTASPSGPAPPFGPSQPGFNTLGAYHLILSTLGIVLLAALLLVYLRTYNETRGIFPLGLLVVFSSLLFQEVISSPLFSRFFENTPLMSGYSGPVADTFRIIAYAIFLYISLE